ncbi:biotin/lipoyl-binding protein, partial [Vibrio campbellii]
MSETATKNQATQAPQPVNKIKRTTNALLALTVVSIGTAIVADRIIPTADNVRVEGNVVSLIPQVSGQVDSVSIKPNTEVKKGDVLLQINTIDHQI